MNKIVYFGLVLLLFGACQRKLVFNEAELIDKFDFEYLTAKSKIDYRDEGNDLNLTANIRIKQDSAIWVSVSPGLNVEVARILLLKDTVHILDRVHKKYVKYIYRELAKQYQIELTYDMIQSVLVGNLVFPYSKENVQRDANSLLYTQQIGSIRFDHMIGEISRKLEQIIISDQTSKNVLKINYRDFKAVDTEVFPFYVQAAISNIQHPEKNVEIQIETVKVQLESKELKFPFSIPGRYE